MYKILFALAFVFILGCGDNSQNPISNNQTDKSTVPVMTYQTILIVDNYESRIYNYEKIFSDGVMLNITFPECDSNGCGISIEMRNIIYYETFK